jgi:L-alanine-DL-glutamate epimerase-like enolase superfamily enzyme
VKITAVKVEEVRLHLCEPFVTALLARDFQMTLFVKVVTDEGVSGFGEAVPTRHVTGETLESCRTAINELGEKLSGMNPLDLERIHKTMDRHLVNNSAAKAGIDIALHDIKGKIMNQPLYRVLGGASNSIETDITFSIMDNDALVEKVKRRVGEGYRIMNIKTGLDPDRDIEAVAKVRESVGGGVVLKIDANQGYSVADAIKVINATKKYNIRAYEQPSPSWDRDGMARIRLSTGAKIIADESIRTHVDAVDYVKSAACDMMNIKLMKSGGIFKAEKINAVCEGAGINCMVGCMVESRIAIAAGAHFAASKINVTEADLDGFILTKELAFVSGGFTAKEGVITLLDKPGLGLAVDF